MSVYRAEEPKWVDVDRARIIWMTGAFYLCAHRPDLVHTGPPDFTQTREYRMDRILEAQVREEPVYLAQLPLLRVRFRLDAEMRGRLQALRDGEGRVVQRVEELTDGEVVVEILEVSLLRARQRVLAFGPHLLAVEEPTELRHDLREAAARLLASL